MTLQGQGAAKGSYQEIPDLPLVVAAKEEEEEERGHHEAENGHKHKPAQRVVRVDVGGGHQDPHQTSKDLQAQEGGQGC